MIEVTGGNIRWMIQRLKRTAERDGIKRARHEFARTKSQLQRWKDRLALRRRDGIWKLRPRMFNPLWTGRR